MNPATEEKTTLIANLALVIARKSVLIDLKERGFTVAFKADFLVLKTAAKIL
jgi:hypothetical protein